MNHNPVGIVLNKNPELTLEELTRARMLMFVMAGVILVTLSIFIARHYQLGQHVAMDFQGERVEGTAEPVEDGAFRLRYEAADGIHARTYRGGFGMQPVKDEAFEVTLVRNPERPNRFQPAGLSYLPGVLTLFVFGAGMVCVLHARRIVIAARRHARQ